MRLTIIPSDKVIGIDGIFLLHKQEDIDWIPSNIHAVQWYDTWGEIEYTDGTANERIENLGIFEQAVEIYRITETRESQEIEQAQNATRDYWQELRMIRDSFLTQSDWTQMVDSPLSEEKKNEWKIYRQNLRDLPENVTDPQPFVSTLEYSGWPAKPS